MKAHPIYPACTADACGQDPRKCKTREACHVPLDDELEGPAKAVVYALAILVCILALAAAVLPLVMP